MKIIIAGLAKTGTTGLFYKIRNSLGAPGREMFEPATYICSENAESVLAKKLIKPKGSEEFDSFACFDKKIGIIRDPRDWMISMLLYRIFDHPACENDDAIRRMMELLRRKEEAPASVSVLEIASFFRGLPLSGSGAEVVPSGPPASMLSDVEAYYRKHVEMITSFFQKHSDYFVMKYEDFVGQRLESLEKYLGISLAGTAAVDAQFQRVVRTKGAGDWRNWFTQEDVLFFKPIFAELLKSFGYPDDWELPDAQTISPEHASGYVRSLICERRAKALLRQPQRAQELIAQARSTFKRFPSRHLHQAQTTRAELEQDLRTLQITFHFLVQRLAELADPAARLRKLESQLSHVREKLETTQIKLDRTRDERGQIENSLAWKLMRPLRFLQKFLGILCVGFSMDWICLADNLGDIALS
ncbi:MAG: hypothetical protein QOD99_2731 [Chthoniobacter sp.]|nr:hypothetical protein [Chthoniobacter sp.]